MMKWGVGGFLFWSLIASCQNGISPANIIIKFTYFYAETHLDKLWVRHNTTMHEFAWSVGCPYWFFSIVFFKKREKRERKFRKLEKEEADQPCHQRIQTWEAHHGLLGVFLCTHSGLQREFAKRCRPVQSRLLKPCTCPQWATYFKHLL